MKKTLAVILNRNGLALTAECCKSLAAQTMPGLFVLVVDNGSSECGQDELRAACPNAAVIRSSVNLGFAGGVNFGLKYAADSGIAYDYVWLLNNDTVCGRGALAALAGSLESDPRNGAAGCSMMQKGGGRLPSAMRMSRPFYFPLPCRASETPEFICGACILIRCEALEDTGSLDERFFFFFEDADWCFRARRRGWNLVIADGARVIHEGGATARRNSYQSSLHYRAGHVLFARRYAACPFAAVLPPLVFRLVSDLTAFRFHSFAGALAGFADGLRK